MNPADFLATEDGQTLVEAGARASFAHQNNPRYVKWDDDQITREWHLSVAYTDLLAALSASKPCPTCGGSGWTQRTREGRRIPSSDPANDPPGPPGRPRSPCPSCQGTGTVPILPIPERRTEEGNP